MLRVLICLNFRVHREISRTVTYDGSFNVNPMFEDSETRKLGTNTFLLLVKQSKIMGIEQLTLALSWVVWE